MPTARRALIAGLGLIGGSIGMALRRAGWRVSFDDPNVTLDAARAAGAADDDNNEGADVIILAMPVDAAVGALGRAEARPALVTSVCSVMGPVRAAADAHGVSFVAGHPLAGSEQRGLAAARGDLFEGKAWFVDREEQLVAGVIGACGARAERVSAEEHDRAVALTSHLPQVLSTALAACLSERRAAPALSGAEGSGEQEILRFAGSGLKAFLRLAGSDASVWLPIIEANRQNIRDDFERVVGVAREIIAGDATAFALAQRFWAELEK